MSNTRKRISEANQAERKAVEQLFPEERKVKGSLYIKMGQIAVLQELAMQYGFATMQDLIKAIAEGVMLLRINPELSEKTVIEKMGDIRADWVYLLNHYSRYTVTEVLPEPTNGKVAKEHRPRRGRPPSTKKNPDKAVQEVNE